MNQNRQTAIELVTTNPNLSDAEKSAINKAFSDLEKKISLTEFKLERTEKDKRTTAILLEETIAELGQKRKAVERQSHELQIEAALERVRSQTMAMQKSDELFEVIKKIYEELQKLGFDALAADLMIFTEDKKGYDIWVSGRYGAEGPYRVGESFYKHPHHQGTMNAWLKGEQIRITELKGEMFTSYFEIVLNNITGLQNLSAEDKNKIFSLGQVVQTEIFTKHGCIRVGGAEKGTEAQLNIQKRFAKVFEQTYTRFLDLQKAEAQARESQIQLALERVRARTMAMQHSDELSETAAVLFEQLKQLGEAPERTFIGIINEDEHVIELWITQHGVMQLNKMSKISIDEPLVLKPMYEAWKQHKKNVIIDLQGNELESYFCYVKNIGVPVDRKAFGERRIDYVAFFSKGMLGVITQEPRPEETLQVLERFSTVFDLTYTRFLDLQKAEAQAREATIEAALERVRARAMAMHTSDDVGDAISILFTELDKLGILTLRCGMLIIEESTKTMEVWTANSTKEGRINRMSMTSHPLLEKAFNSWKQNELSFFYELKGNDLENYYKALSSGAPQYDLNKENIVVETQFSSVFFFKEGALFTFTSAPFLPETCKVLEKFAAVFGLTYRRYMDLKIAEEQMRRAVIQASLDRVRAEIASMRSKEDLQSITPLIWRELKILNVPFIRCGVFIVDDALSKVQLYLSTPAGQPLGVLNLREDEGELTHKIVDYWRKGAVYKEHWNKEQFLNWMQSMIERGQISNRETYQGEATPPELLDLHFVPFTQGMLYVGNTAPLTRDEIELVKSLADAFAIAYARYEDFKHLDNAKNKVDATLIELKTAQAQLIQREKMASLGELTAGIAHEIQNPLNFVNNFSDVNKELITELREEQHKHLRDLQLESAILKDLEENMSKIAHHGKRADSIVKGMLEHSRISKGEKQATDINALADEYLRLSYQGLRVKDKFFNSIIHTDFDVTIDTIDIVPQDMGRVLLNLFNNAFYAVYQKLKQLPKGYEPAVSVSIKGINGTIEIRIKDNGSGIPQKIIDKIFQPFFTTKPTGEGTGLGLSLSYDIIKAHGGELTVSSIEGEGSEFIIRLPV